MHDKSSFLRLASSLGTEMSEAIAAEVQAICRRAAEPVRPGEGVKAQILRSWKNLERPPFWRVRAGWYEEGGHWSAAAVRDFQDRYRAFLAREARRVAHEKTVEAAKRRTAEAEYVRVVRADYQDIIERIAALEAAFRLRS